MCVRKEAAPAESGACTVRNLRRTVFDMDDLENKGVGKVGNSARRDGFHHQNDTESARVH